MKNKKTKVVVAMSGGVDSSVVAFLLKEQGYEVIGVFMQFWYPSGESKYGENRCCSLESYNEAREVARLLDIPIYKINFGKEFKKQIVDEFLAEYKNGRTPNPCVACNKFVKFDLLLEYAKTVFYADYLATGHYARLSRKFSIFNFQFSKKQQNSKNQKQENIKTKKQKEEYSLYRPKDKNKDQTYFLYNLKQSQLKQLLFPLADLTKDQVRGLAKKLKLPIHDKADSQEVCFVGKSTGEFLSRYLKLKSGKIIDETGNVLGEHRGLALYTIGQRSGLGLSGGPWYVVGFRRQNNQLLVSKNFDSPKLLNKIIKFKSASWLSDTPKSGLVCSAQIRHHGTCIKCQLIKTKTGWQAEFVKPQHAVMAGQSIVFYDGERLLGGGIIS